MTATRRQPRQETPAWLEQESEEQCAVREWSESRQARHAAWHGREIDFDELHRTHTPEYASDGVTIRQWVPTPATQARVERELAEVELRPEDRVSFTRCVVAGLQDDALWSLSGEELLAYCQENYPNLIVSEAEARQQAHRGCGGEPLSPPNTHTRVRPHYIPE